MERYSMNDFKPLTLREKKLRLENEVGEIENKKHPLILRKQQIELELSSYNSIVRSREYKDDEYSNICKSQYILKKEKTDIEVKILKLKEESKKINSKIDGIHLSIKKIPNDVVKQGMLELRDKYMSFAADTTRVSSMRAMSSRFVEEIQKILSMIEEK